MRTQHIVLVALALIGSVAYCQEGYGEGGGDEYGEGGGGGGGPGGGGGYGGEEPPAPPPPSSETQELNTVEDFEAFLDNADASVICALTAKEVVDPTASLPDGWDVDEDGEWSAEMIENPALTNFNSISASAYGYRYAYTSAPEVLAKLKSKTGGLFLYRSPKFVSKEHGDRPRERYPSDKLTESGVSNWLKSKAQPLVGQFSHSTKDRYTSAVLVIFMNLDFDKNGQSVNYVLKRARKAAVGLKGKLSIAVAALSEMNYDLNDYGLTSTKPTADILMGIRSGSDFYGSAVSAFNGNSLSAFATSFLAGELEPFVKPPYEPPAGDDENTNEDADEDTEGADDDKEEM